jgi:hypothetical protein
LPPLLPAFALGIVGTAALFTAALAPRQGSLVAIVMEPGLSPQHIVAATAEAGWRPVRLIRSFVILAAPEAAQTTHRRPHGAVFLVNAEGLRGCPSAIDKG